MSKYLYYKWQYKPPSEYVTRYVQVDPEARTIRVMFINDITGEATSEGFCPITKGANERGRILPGQDPLPTEFLHEVYYTVRNTDSQQTTGLILGNHTPSTEREFLTAVGVI